MKHHAELLHCEDCEHWSFGNNIGYCALHRNTLFSWSIICRSYKPKVTKPEPEQERVHKVYKYLGMDRSRQIVAAIGDFLIGNTTYSSFVYKMWDHGFLNSAAQDLADRIEQFRKPQPKTVIDFTTPLPAHWLVHLAFLRSLYMSDTIDMDVVLATLDPSRSGSDVVGDLVSAWEAEKERLGIDQVELDRMCDMIDTHTRADEKHGSLKDHEGLSEMYGARRYNSEDLPEPHDDHVDYVDWNYPIEDVDDDA